MVGRLIRGCAFVLILFTLAACGSSDEYSPYGGTEHPTQIKIGKPYAVNGVRYVPHYDAGYNETGMASWYGPEFHGRMTASGERYDKHELTAAHRTLPMPSIVRVTRLDTGKSVKVRINDRGPFSRARIIDVSQAAAEALHMIGVGTARVRVQYLPGETEALIAELGLRKPEGWGPAPLMTAQAEELGEQAPMAGEAPSLKLGFISSAYADTPGDSATASYRVQAASFADKQNAERVADTLRNLSSTLVKPIETSRGLYYRVSLGPLSRYEDARRLLAEVEAMGYRDARIMIDEM